MIDHGLKFHFAGIDEDDFCTRVDSRVSVLSGTNNCGKTLILKRLYDRFGDEAYFCGTDRYYTAQGFPVYGDSTSFFKGVSSSIRSMLFSDPSHNTDPAAMKFQDLFIRMTDTEREDVYRICGDFLREPVRLAFSNPDNSMSSSFLTIGDTPLAKCSSGSRMLVNLVSVLLCKRFKVLLLDEPELGMTPRIQNAIQHLLYDSENESLAHLRHVYVATHSHIFLNRRRLSDNFVVQRDGDTVNITRVSGYDQYRDLQFSQLGNSFEQLQLPSGFIIVEGKTDYAYVTRLLRLKFPETRVNVINANGDGQVKMKLHDLLEVVG